MSTRPQILVALMLALSLTACERKEADAPPAPPPAIAPVLLTPEAVDVASYAKPAEARVTHVALDLKVDFATKRVSGTATLDLKTAPTAKAVVLDTKGLDIKTVHDETGAVLPFTLGKADPILGAPLTVTLNGARRIIVDYASRPDAAGLQWLTPAQTAGKKQPYLFSQGEAILNRTWIPTQDSPGIRQTWEARITVPEQLKAVMSAEMLTPKGEKVTGGRQFSFRMNEPVAPYLIALAVGDISFQSLGKRTGVYTEPSMLAASAAELVDVEKMIDAAESLYGPYRWGRYDLLVLPPSFPFGGMENPRLTFATPTILAGDRSLVTLVAHELAHSWSGNLVTNATWSDFWLNEGFTTYFENRIMEKLYGQRRAAMQADLGWADLQTAVKEAGGPTAPGTKLHFDVTGIDPDDGMTEVAYQKGASFLRVIEQAVGREKFDAYLRSYFDRFAFQPQTTAGFLADIRKNLIKGDAALEAKIGLDEWAYQPGVPANAVHVQSEAFVAVDEAAKAFVGKPGTPGTSAASLATSDWSAQEWVWFLNALPRKLTPAQLDDLDRSFNLSTTGNSEKRFAWLQLAIANKYEPAVVSLEDFLTSQGRRKFVQPLFTSLMADPTWGAPIARRIYEKARPGYHPLVTAGLDSLVK
jgi:leukotriene-A4 hydrolase